MNFYLLNRIIFQFFVGEFDTPLHPHGCHTTLHFVWSIVLADESVYTDVVAIPNPARKGGVYMSYLISFLSAVVAEVAGHYFCKWCCGQAFL